MLITNTGPTRGKIITVIIMIIKSKVNLTQTYVNYKKGCTRLAAASDKVYRLLAHGRWFSPGTRHDIAETLLKVVLKHKKNQSNQSITQT